MILFIPNSFFELMFKIFRYFIKKRAKVSFTRPIQTFKFDFNLKVSKIELFELEKFDSNLKCMAGYESYFSQYNIKSLYDFLHIQQDFYLIKYMGRLIK
jgi:hypothetical protein